MKDFKAFRNTPGSIAVPQTRDAYERVLSHHGQWFRWTKGFLCPCLSEVTQQPDPQCNVCGGRGFIYRNPRSFKILYEFPRHDVLGRVYLEYPLWNNDINSVEVRDKNGNVMPLGVQPPDYSYIQLAGSSFPYPFEPMTARYEAALLLNAVGENSEVVATNTLRPAGPQKLTEEGKIVSGAVELVTRVYNASRGETYTVSSINKDYVYLTSMGTWQAGDTLEVDYSYTPPLSLVMYGISQKMRWERSYIADEANAVLVTPYYLRPRPEDLFTALSQEQGAEEIIDPAPLGNDVLHRFFDVASIEAVIRKDGYQYDPVADVRLFGRNELQWITTKPTQRCVVVLTYHPTYRGLSNLPSVRNSENKSFAIRTSVVMFDRVSPQESHDFALHLPSPGD
jgi:hypothetical protein